MSHNISLPQVVSRHLPEFVREDYPTFVAFVEAYYEYLTSNGVDISHMKDIDSTIEDFIVLFKKELAYNLPIVVQDERFLLSRIKDLYLAKGSEGSFKLLFRLLFGKDVGLYYPGQQMLVPSDGKWNQEISVFVKVDYGDVNDIVGRLVEISSGDRVISVLIDRKEELIGEIERVQIIGNGIYELYLDKRFFGVINPGDNIRYKDIFQCTILPATTTLSIIQQGKNFRVGQVFELRSGNGTGALVKVTAITETGGIKRAELIKFGIGYTADFAISVLASNSVTSKQTVLASGSSRSQTTTYQSETTGAITFSSGSDQVAATNGASFGGTGEVQVGDELWINPPSPDITTPEDIDVANFVGVVKSIESSTSLTLEQNSTISGTNEVYVFRNDQSVGDAFEYLIGLDTYEGIWTSSALQDRTIGFEEQGYVNLGDVFTYEYVDGTYAGSIIREFALNSANAQVQADDPAIISVTLGALNRYPGYFETNHGFLSDSIFIQDSKYYQRFSYVLKIDERLDSYASAVKTMVHPAGMRLFGEFDVTNNFDLTLALDSLVKSLGIGLEDDVIVDQSDWYFTFTKEVTDSITAPDDSDVKKLLEKSLSDSTNTLTESFVQQFSKSLADTSVGTLTDTNWVHTTTKSLTDTAGTWSQEYTHDIGKSLSDVAAISEDLDWNMAKYVEDTSVGTFSNRANIYLNSYNAQDYWIYTEEYEGGLQESTTN